MKKYLVRSLCSLLFIVVVGWSPLRAIRIVSLSPQLTKDIVLLKLGKSVVGCTANCPLAQNTPVVTLGIHINIEKIVVQKPTIVLTSYLNSAKEIARIKSFGLKTVYFDMPHNFKELCDQFIDLAKLLNRENEAKKIVSQQTERLQRLRQLVIGKERLRFVLQVGRTPLFVVGGESLLSDYIRQLGGVNIFEDRNTGIVSREKILLLNPDVILLYLDENRASIEQEVWQQFLSLKAVSNNQVISVVSDEASSSTPVSFVDVLEYLMHKLYAEKHSNA